MKLLMRSSILLIFASFFFIECTPPKQTVSNDFYLGKGVNISHWLSQSSRRGEKRKDYFTEKDVIVIAEAGFDHIRLPIDEEQMWNESGKKEDEAFDLMHQAINWGLSQDLKMVIDLHILRSHHFIADERPLFTDEKEMEKFAGFWSDLSDELEQYPEDMVVYELLNEAVANDHDEWNKVFLYPYKTIREKEPARKIILGSNKWQDAHNMPYLKIPEGDPNIILSFHFYIPMPVTHYGASWTEFKDLTCPVYYPGTPLQALDTVGLDDAQKKLVLDYSKEVYNKEKMAEHVDIAKQVADSLGLNLYCGEFGVYEKTPEDVALRWYTDFIQVLNEKNISWAAWDYKNSFGVFDPKTLEPKDAKLEVLMQ